MQTKNGQLKKVIGVAAIAAIVVGAVSATYYSFLKPSGNVSVFFKDPLYTDAVGNYTVYLNENVTVLIVLRNVTGSIASGNLTLWTRGPSLDAVDVLAGDLGKPVFTIENPNRAIASSSTPGSEEWNKYVICMVNISSSISPPVSESNGTLVFAKIVFRGMDDGSATLWLGAVRLFNESGNALPFTDKWNGLYDTMIVKFLRSTVFLQPAITEIQLQNTNEEWITIWQGSKTLPLVPGEPAKFVEAAYVPTGSYVASRVKYSNFITAFDATGDGDADDKWYNPGLRMWLNETVGTNLGPHWFSVTIARIEHSIEVSYPVDEFNDNDYLSSFKQGYFRAVWPTTPWVFNAGTLGNLTYALSYQRPVDAHMGDPIGGEPWYVAVIAEPR